MTREGGTEDDEEEEDDDDDSVGLTRGGEGRGEGEEEEEEEKELRTSPVFSFTSTPPIVKKGAAHATRCKLKLNA